MSEPPPTASGVPGWVPGPELRPPGALMPLWVRILTYVLLQAGIWFAANLVLAVVATILVGTGLQKNGESIARLPEAVLLVELAWSVPSLALTAVYWIFLDRRPWWEFGLRLGSARDWALGIGLGLAPVAVAYPIALAAGHIRIEGFVSPSVPFLLYRLCILVLMCLAVGIAEELPFRGYLLPNLSGGIGRPAAVLLTSVVFTMVHFMDPEYMRPLNIVDVVLIGMALAWLRLGTGSIIVPIAAHAAYDLALFLLVGHPDVDGLLKTEIQPENLWLGGEKSAGLLDIAVAVAWAAFIWVKIYRPSLRTPAAPDTPGGGDPPAVSPA